MNKELKTRFKLASVLYLASVTALTFAMVYSASNKKPVKKDLTQEEPTSPIEEVIDHVDTEEVTVLVEHKTQEQMIDELVDDICTLYDKVEPELVKSIIYHESSYNPEAANHDRTCVGLMQIHTFWHRTRAYELGVDNFFDPEGNILLGVDYLQELFEMYEKPELVLMLYNMEHDTAFEMYNRGEVSNYAKSVLERAEMLKNGGV